MWPVGTRDACGVFLVQPTANAISSDEKKKESWNDLIVHELTLPRENSRILYGTKNRPPIMTRCVDLSKYMCTAKHISTPLASVYVGERNENFLLYMVPHDSSTRLENEELKIHSMPGRFFSG